MPETVTGSVLSTIQIQKLGMCMFTFISAFFFV